MLNIFILASTSLTPLPPVSSSVTYVKSAAMSSDSNESKPNYLLQQMYGTQVLDKDIDLELSDAELELIAETPPVCKSNDKGSACTEGSDVFVGGQKIISFNSIDRELLKPEKHNELIDYIKSQFKGITVDREDTYERIAEHIRDTAPIQTKRENRGLKIGLTGRYAGVECYANQQCQY